MTRRLISFLCAVAVLCSCMTVTAYAAQESGWIELLEYTSVREDGDNWFTVSGTTGSVTIPLQGEKRLRKIDMLLWNPTNQRPASASVTAGSTTTALDIYQLGSNMCRIVGYLPSAYYEAITVKLVKTSSTAATYEVLSCKVTPLGVQEYLASADVYLDSFGTTGTYSTNYNIPFYKESSSGSGSDGGNWLARVQVSDWEKFDTLSIWGSVSWASIESIRVSVGTTALDYTVNYIDAEASEYAVDGDPTYWVTPEWGKYLYSITVDLSNVDRTLSEPLYIYFTGTYDLTVSAYFNCQYVNGSVTTADTTTVSWWHRFTTFLTGLLGGDGTNTDEFEDESAQQGGEMGELNDELQNVTKPPIEDIQTDVDDYLDPEDAQETYAVFASLTGNSLVSSMLVMALTVALVAYVLYGKR